jgi:hypothetical protein
MRSNSKKAAVVYPMLIASMVMFTACTSTEKPVANAATPIASSTPNVVVEPSATPSAGPTTTSAPTSTPSGSVNVKPVNSETTTSVTKQIKDMFELAKVGKVAGIEFAGETSFFQDVEKAWGKADSKDAA